MTIVVKEDLTQGATLTMTLGVGKTTSRTFIVSGLEGDRHQILDMALLAPGIPRTGDLHPSIDVIKVKTLGVVPAEGSSNIAIVTANYETIPSNLSTQGDGDAPDQINVGGTVQSTTTNKYWKNGNKREDMIIKYEYKKGKNKDGRDPKRKQIGEVSIEIPSIVASLSRTEDKHPLAKAQKYLGKINSTQFMGGAPGNWICTQLNGTSADGGETYQVNYEFQYNPDSWNPLVAFIETETGRIPPDANEKNGMEKFQIYKSIDFRRLNLGSFR